MEVSAVHNDTHSTCLPGKSDLIIGTLASVWRDGSHPKAGLVLWGQSCGIPLRIIAMTVIGADWHLWYLVQYFGSN